MDIASETGSWNGLLAAIERHYSVDASRRVPGHALLARAADALARLDRPSRKARPMRLPVSRMLADCVAAASPLQGMAEVLLLLSSSLEWLQNPNYTEANVGPRFLEGYGYVEPVGPGRLFDCPRLRVGFLLLGPGLTYPDHAHAAEEVYHVVAGPSWWWREGDSWREAEAGTAIHHAPWIRHATRTGDAPMLALYCWGGDIDAHAALSVGPQSLT
jgi:hypothetical protein